MSRLPACGTGSAPSGPRPSGLAAPARGERLVQAHAGNEGRWLGALPGDYDGDGRGDVVWYGAGTPGLGLVRADRRDPRPAVTAAGTDHQPFVGDFDHDGRSDVFWWAGRCRRLDLVRGDLGVQGEGAVDVHGRYRPVVGDFDGDLRSDVLWYGAGGHAGLPVAGGRAAAPGRSGPRASPGRTSRWWATSGGRPDRCALVRRRWGSRRRPLAGGRAEGFTSRSATVPYFGVPLVGDFAGRTRRRRPVVRRWKPATCSGPAGPPVASIARSLFVGVGVLPAGRRGRRRRRQGRRRVVGAGAATDSVWRSHGDGTFITVKPTIPYLDLVSCLSTATATASRTSSGRRGGRTGRLLAEHLVLRQGRICGATTSGSHPDLVLRSASCRPSCPRRCCAGTDCTSRRSASR